jgi:hypothetical protein
MEWLTLLSKCEAQSSNPGTTTEIKEEFSAGVIRVFYAWDHIISSTNRDKLVSSFLPILLTSLSLLVWLRN